MRKIAKSLLSFVLAVFVVQVWAVDPVAVWSDFSEGSLESGDYTLTRDEDESLKYVFQESEEMSSQKKLSLELELTFPAAGRWTSLVLMDLNVGQSKHVKIIAHENGALSAYWNEGLGDQLKATYELPLSGFRKKILISYKGEHNQGTDVYVDGVLAISQTGLMTTGGTLHQLNILGEDDVLNSIKLYNCKLTNDHFLTEMQNVEEPKPAWVASFDGFYTSIGWITSWGGETPRSYVDTPNGKGFIVAESPNKVQPWANYDLNDEFSVALYADVSQVSVPVENKHGAVLIAFGNGNNSNPASHIAVVKTAKNTIQVWQNDNFVQGLQIESDTLDIPGSFHLIAFGSDGNGAFLKVDEKKVVVGSALLDPVLGCQIGSMYGAIRGYVQAYGMIVDEVRGFSKLLSDDELGKLEVKFSAAEPISLEVREDISIQEFNIEDNINQDIKINIMEGKTLTINAAPMCRTLTIISASDATVALGEGGSFSNVRNVILEGHALSISASLLNTAHVLDWKLDSLTLKGGIDGEHEVLYEKHITVASGKTLKTEGYLNLSGANTIAVDGALEVVSGKTSLAARDRGIKGTITIDVDAELVAASTDALDYDHESTVKVYGTLNMSDKRWTLFDGNIFELYVGSRIVGGGENGRTALEVCESNTIYIRSVEGANTTSVSFSAPIRARDNDDIVTFDISEGCVCELSAKVDGPGKIKAYGSGVLKLIDGNTYSDNFGGTIIDATIEFAGGSFGSRPLSGEGSLNVSSGELNLREANGNYSGVITIAEGAKLKTTSHHTSPFGAGKSIVNNGEIIVQSTGAPVIRAAISGKGSLTLKSGSLTLSGNNTYEGGTFVEGGTLKGVPDGSVEVSASSEEEAVANVQILRPEGIDDDVVSAEDYANYFIKSAIRGEEGKYSVTAALNPDVVTPTIADVQDGEVVKDAFVVDAATGDVSLNITNKKPGLFYAVQVQGTLDGAVHAIVPESDGKLVVPVDKLPPQGNAAFFRVIVDFIQIKEVAPSTEPAE